MLVISLIQNGKIKLKKKKGWFSKNVKAWSLLFLGVNVTWPSFSQEDMGIPSNLTSWERTDSIPIQPDHAVTGDFWHSMYPEIREMQYFPFNPICWCQGYPVCPEFLLQLTIPGPSGFSISSDYLEGRDICSLLTYLWLCHVYFVQ